VYIDRGGGRVVFVGVDCTGEGVKATADRRDYQMLGRELDLGMGPSITHAIGKLLCVTRDTLVSCSCAHSALPLLDNLEVLLLRFLGRLDTIESAVLRDLQPPM